MTGILPSSLIRGDYIKLVRRPKGTHALLSSQILDTLHIQAAIPTSLMRSNTYKLSSTRICIQSYHSCQYNVGRCSRQELCSRAISEKSARKLQDIFAEHRKLTHPGQID